MYGLRTLGFGEWDWSWECIDRCGWEVLDERVRCCWCGCAVIESRGCPIRDGGTSFTGLAVIDMDRGRYGALALAEPRAKSYGKLPPPYDVAVFDGSRWSWTGDGEEEEEIDGECVEEERRG